ncbi:MAG: hybrid sensor histidine kinase/response regulator [Bacteroidales bacterium]|nr:hybrid sensor histidine kinase/response regulator [Bacteroidales bacterium]
MTEQNSNSFNILVVDDNPRNLQVISTLLSANGYKTAVVNSGTNALKYMEMREPDLILLDIMMPEMSGYEVCTIIKEDERYKEIPVIFLTAKSELSDIIMGFKLGAVDYITKPFRIEEVLVRVRTHLELRESRKQLLHKNMQLESLNKELTLSQEQIREDALRLKQLVNEKNQLFSIIAHDLRGPINSFISLTRLLADEAAGISPELIMELSADMHQSASSLHELLENLLSWSLMQRDEVRMNQEDIFLKPLIDSVLELLKEKFVTKNILINNTIPPNLAVKGDWNMVSTVARNLITNAVKFTPQGGEVSLSGIQDANGMVIITVQDTGIGMSAELIGRLFQFDKRTSRPGTDGEPSSGLGLMLCKEFIERNGGQLKIRSQENVGSVFEFTLPEA